MRLGFVKRRQLWALAAGAGLLGLAPAPALGQIFHRGRDHAPPPPCPPVYVVPAVPAHPPAAPAPTTPTTPPTTDVTAPTPPTVDLSGLAPEAAGAGAADTVAFAPNMIGDLLRAYKGVTFSYLQAGDFAIANTSGTVNFRNTKISENNSALPQDRASFRYNYFHNALDVAGLASSPVLGPPISQVAGGQVFQFNQVVPATRSYNVNLYTFQFEKAFLDQRFSVEVRIPFASSVASDLDLVSGTLLFPDRTDRVPLVEPTPGSTLGDSNTEWQDMQVILKALVWSDCRKRWFVSTGLGFGIPTGQDLNVRVVDFSNDVPGDPFDIIDPFRRPNQFAFDQRTRFFNVQNETLGLSPFLAVVGTPTNRTFLNGFWQIDVPLNRSDWTYREVDVDLEVLFDSRLANSGLNPVQYDRTLSGEIRDQVLMHFDIGGGYWVYLNPCARFLNGIAAIGELHYTTTLNDADLVTVDAIQLRTQTGTGGVTAPEPQPVIGNTRNRMDILNATVGTTMLLGNTATLATGFAFPLRRESDRTFDWEFQLQFNYYFGGPRRLPIVPTMQ